MRALPGLILGLALCGPALAAGPQQVKIATDWDGAFEAAKKRNIPVLVVLGSDNKGKAPWVATFKDKGMVRYLNDRVIVIVGHSGTKHKPAKRVDRKTRKEIEYCPLYPSITCAVHNTIITDKAGFFDYDTLPAGFVVSPEKKVLVKKVETSGPKALPKKIEEAQRKIGEGVFLSDIKRLNKKLAKADKKLAEGKLSTARRHYEKYLKKKRLKKFIRDLAKKRLEKLDARARELIKDALKEKPGPAKEILKRIAREMRGRKPSEEAEQALKGVK